MTLANNKRLQKLTMAMITQASTERVLYMRTNQQTLIIKEGSYDYLTRTKERKRQKETSCNQVQP